MPNTLTFSYDRAQRDLLAERSLVPYVEELKKLAKDGGYAAPESAINSAHDKSMLKEVADVIAKKTSNKLRFVVLIGIGGSNMGAQAIYQAIRGEMDAYTPDYPKMLFLETTAARAMMDVVDVLGRASSKDEFLINIVTKSGTTVETIANAEALIEALAVRFGDVGDRIIVSTNKDSPLWKVAGKRRLARMAIPRMVGGRFSVFTAVGQVPLALARIDVHALITGAGAMLKRCTQKTNNPAAISAGIIYYYRTNNIRVHNTFLFNPELESYGKWHRQLMAESLGKRENDVGHEVREGLMPIISIGTADLHALAQLYLAGPRDKLTTFVYAKQMPSQVKVPQTSYFGNVAGDIEGASFKKIMEAIYLGTKAAYDHNELPYMEVRLPAINENTLGQLMMWKVCETMFLARLLNVNAFNQPNVEEYKSAAHALLKGVT